MSYTTGKFTVDEIGFIQSAMSKVLAAVARGELDLNLLAREELAARGQDLDGMWVGFKRAEELHFGKKSTTPVMPEKNDLQAAQLAQPLTDARPDRITLDQLVKFWGDWSESMDSVHPFANPETKVLRELSSQGFSSFDPSVNYTLARTMMKWSSAREIEDVGFYADRVIGILRKLKGAEDYLKNKENLSFNFAKQPIIDVLSIKNNELLINTFAIMGRNDVYPDKHNTLHILNAIQDSSTINIKLYYRANNEPGSDDLDVVFMCSIDPDWLITCDVSAHYTDLPRYNLSIPDELITHRLSNEANNISKHLMKAVQGMLAEYGLTTQVSDPREVPGRSFLAWDKAPAPDENQDESSTLNPYN